MAAENLVSLGCNLKDGGSCENQYVAERQKVTLTDENS